MHALYPPRALFLSCADTPRRGLSVIRKDIFITLFVFVLYFYDTYNRDDNKMTLYVVHIYPAKSADIVQDE